MFRHVVMWKFKEGLTEEDNKANALKIKDGLEGLKELIPAIVDIKVIINELPYSTHDILLDCTFANEDGFKVYKAHPEHLEIAVLTKKVLQDRVCVDYVE